MEAYNIKNNKKQYLFWDMDNVLNEFQLMSDNLLKKIGKPLLDINKSSEYLTDDLKKYKEDFWKIVKEQDNFWENLPVNPEGLDLYTLYRNQFHKIFILSSLPKNKNIFSQQDIEKIKKQKIEWIFKNIDPDFMEENIILTLEKKENYIVDDALCVLIDDREGNIKSWNDNSGWGLA